MSIFLGFAKASLMAVFVEITLIATREFAPGGYGWVFPWGENRIKIGIDIFRPYSDARPREMLQKLIENASRLGINLNGARRVGTHSGSIPAGGLSRQLVGNGLIIVGDAGGQVFSWNSEGLRTSMDAGADAGKTATEAVKANDYSREFLFKHYEKPWRKKHEKNMRIADSVTRRVHSWDDKKMDEAVEFTKLLTPDQVAQIMQSNFLTPPILRLIIFHPAQVLHFLRK